ncbi:hypothetical protein MCEPE89_00330 [Candidatus Planktophila dulcis]
MGGPREIGALSRFLARWVRIRYSQFMTSEKVCSEIFDTGNPKIKSARIIVQASPSTIFAILSNPKRHRDIDGSATITENISGPDELILGSKFGMKMHLGVDYRILNTVVEYKKDSLIAWRHLGRWRWRYELTALGNGSTQVTESFDGTYAPAVAQVWLYFRKAYPWTQLAVAKTLVRLKAVAEAS